MTGSREADLVLHVRDVYHPGREEQWRTVKTVLRENGIEQDRVLEAEDVAYVFRGVGSLRWLAEKPVQFD